MKRFITLFLLLLTPYSLLAYTKVTTMKEMLPYLQRATRSTLTIFDVDGVLVQPTEPAFQLPNWKKHKAIFTEATNCFTQEQMITLLILMITTSDSQIIDEDVYLIFDHLRKHQIPTIALTACLTGEFGDVLSLEDWRIGHLNKHGIDFADITPYKNAISFTDFPSYRGNYPLLKQGIVFTNNNGSEPSKGETLLAYLEETKHHPTEVIFIDDREHYLESVEKSLQEYDPSIKFVGLHYKGAYHFPSPEISAEEFQLKWEYLVHLTKKVAHEH